MGRRSPPRRKPDVPADRPSADRTREMEALTAEALAKATADSSFQLPPAEPTPERLPPPEPTRRAVDDLAQTIEAPSAPRLVILEAAETTIEEIGFELMTEGAVAHRANVDLDVLHAHFANKHTLLAALTDRFCDQAIRLTDEATRKGIWHEAAPRDVLEVAVRTLLDIVLDRGPLIRAVLSTGDPRMLDAFRRVGGHMTAKLTEVVAETKSTADPRDVAFGLLLAISLAHHMVLVGSDWTGLEFDLEEIYDRITRAVVAYVESAAAARGSC